MTVESFMRAARLIFFRLRGRKVFRATKRHYSKNFPDQVVVATVSPEVGVQVLRISNCPVDELVTFITYGLSRYAFNCLSGSGSVGVELSLTVGEQCGLPIEKVVEDIVRLVLYSGRLLLPGTTIEYNFSEELEDQSLSVCGFYCWSSVWHSPEVNSIENGETQRALLVELIPITLNELSLIQSCQDDFIRQTVEGSIDLLDFSRAT